MKDVFEFLEVIKDIERLPYVGEMYSQIGGDKFIQMVNPKLGFLFDKDLSGEYCRAMIAIQLPSSEFNIYKIRLVEFILKSDDTYTFKFYKKNQPKPFKSITNVYCDEVMDIFEKETNLLVTPYKRKGSRVVIGNDWIVK